MANPVVPRGHRLPYHKDTSKPGASTVRWLKSKKHTQNSRALTADCLNTAIHRKSHFGILKAGPPYVAKNLITVVIGTPRRHPLLQKKPDQHKLLSTPGYVSIWFTMFLSICFSSPVVKRTLNYRYPKPIPQASSPPT